MWGLRFPFAKDDCVDEETKKNVETNLFVPSVRSSNATVQRNNLILKIDSPHLMVVFVNSAGFLDSDSLISGTNTFLLDLGCVVRRCQEVNDFSL